MKSRLPQGNKLIIPVDTNMINSFVEIDKMMQKNSDQTDIDPLTIPTNVFTDYVNLSEADEERYSKCKLVSYGLYKLFKEGKAFPFISPIVLNEVRNMSLSFERELFLKFIKKYALMPAVDNSNEKPVLFGQKEVEQLAQRYCEPYDFTYISKISGKQETGHSNYGPMEYVASDDIFEEDSSPRKPSPDAKAMAWAARFRLSFITLNERHFIYLNKPGDNFRRKGIQTINQQELGTSYFETPIPYHPTELYTLFRKRKRTEAVSEVEVFDPTPFDVNEFYMFLSLKFGRVDMFFFESAESVFNIANFKESKRQQPAPVPIVEMDNDEIDDSESFENEQNLT